MNISVLVHIQQIYPQQQKKKKKKKTTGVYINMCVCKSFHKSIFHREPEYINDAKKQQITNASQKKRKRKVDTDETKKKEELKKKKVFRQSV